MRKEGGMLEIYKNSSMSILQKYLFISKFVFLLSSYSAQSKPAFCLPCQLNSQLPETGGMPELKYYRLNLADCKNCPEFLQSVASSSAVLGTEEFEQMRASLEKSIRRYNSKSQHKPGFLITQQKYGVQYVPYIDKKGEKLIWINAFCDGMGATPESEIVDVFDSGSCFFNTIICCGRTKATSILIHGFA